MTGWEGKKMNRKPLLFPPNISLFFENGTSIQRERLPSFLRSQFVLASISLACIFVFLSSVIPDPVYHLLGLLWNSNLLSRGRSWPVCRTGIPQKTKQMIYGKEMYKKVRGTCTVVLVAVAPLNLKVNKKRWLQNTRLSYNFPNLTYVLFLQ